MCVEHSIFSGLSKWPMLLTCEGAGEGVRTQCEDVVGSLHSFCFLGLAECGGGKVVMSK